VARSRETALAFLHDLVVEEIMFLRACGGLCVVLGATTSKWDHSLEALFNEPSKALTQWTAVEKGIDLHVQTCNLARLNVQKGS
jgi:hypothetical protein